MKYVLSTIIVLLAATAGFTQTTKYKDTTEVPRMSLEDAKKAYDDKSAIFIDARLLSRTRASISRVRPTFRSDLRPISALSERQDDNRLLFLTGGTHELQSGAPDKQRRYSECLCSEGGHSGVARRKVSDGKGSVRNNHQNSRKVTKCRLGFVTFRVFSWLLL